jgi:hypothetical protein
MANHYRNATGINSIRLAANPRRDEPEMKL